MARPRKNTTGATENKEEKVNVLKASKKDLVKIIEDVKVDDEDAYHKVSVSKEMKEDLREMANHGGYIRHFVDQYDQAQKFRIRAENQTRALLQGYDMAESRHADFLKSNLIFYKQQEEINKYYLSVMTENIPICQWMRAIKGIGPIFAAYLYATLDITKAQYATNMLSYCGLNDNNNPWLGKEKSSAIVKELLAQREETFKPMDEVMKKTIKGMGISWTKYQDTMKQAIRNFFEEKLDGMDKECKGFIVGKHNDTLSNILMRNLVYLDNEFLTYMDYALGEISEEKIAPGFHKKIFDNRPDVTEYFMTYGYPKFAGPILIAGAADKTGRNIDSIKKGISSSVISKSNKKESKDMHFTVPMAEDLSSYLAKPPYNLTLKTRCFQIGDSFVKQKGRGSLYGRISEERYAMETANNEKRMYADQAANLLATKYANLSKTSQMYKTLADGKLIPAHLTARARRYAVKLFISHVYEAMYYDHYHEEAPKHYILSIGGHHDYIGPEVDYREFLR